MRVGDDNHIMIILQTQFPIKFSTGQTELKMDQEKKTGIMESLIMSGIQSNLRKEPLRRLAMVLLHSNITGIKLQ